MLVSYKAKAWMFRDLRMKWRKFIFRSKCQKLWKREGDGEWEKEDVVRWRFGEKSFVRYTIVQARVANHNGLRLPGETKKTPSTLNCAVHSHAFSGKKWTSPRQSGDMFNSIWWFQHASILLVRNDWSLNTWISTNLIFWSCLQA